MAKNKVSVNFCKNNLYMYEFLKSKDNSSSYICDLVRRDMKEHYKDIDLEAKIKEIIDKLFKDKQLLSDSSDKLSESCCNNLTNEELDLILNLF